MKLCGHVLQLIFIPALFAHQILAATHSMKSNIERNFAPWLVSLRQNFNHHHLCSGSLISHYFIISVAECVAAIVADHQLPANIMAIVGTENLFIGGYKYDINDVFMHPEYYEQQQQQQQQQKHERDNSNLALFQTTTPILFSTKVHPIALESDCTPDYETLHTFGYGWLVGVKKTTVIALNQEMCALHGAHSMADFLKMKFSTKLCTYDLSLPDNFCIDDSRGNAIVNLKSPPHLVAISSKTNSCNIRYPTANTRIAAHIGWISKIMRINEPQIVNMMHSQLKNFK